ncbi:MAG: aminotransferase class I/II-fold pyridoxal phosphate-dependent enzyme, partial [Lachnospiraceae bacterium]|nr:aminotransferase class I/II-fold pyridoxal phosphate-dependent enzyme [Lachnospiraceae bacterium]
TYAEKHVSIAALPGMKDRTIVVNGFSKAYAMTGWRLGYVCAPAPILAQIRKIHQYCIMCAPTTSQYAAIVALRDADEDVVRMRDSYNERRRLVLHLLREMGLPVFEPQGAFYIFPCIKEFGMSSEEFATRLLNEEKVAIVPGTAFGDSGEGYLRISYAYSIENLREALGRLSKFVKRLREQKN